MSTNDSPEMDVARQGVAFIGVCLGVARICPQGARLKHRPEELAAVPDFSTRLSGPGDSVLVALDGELLTLYRGDSGFCSVIPSPTRDWARSRQEKLAGVCEHVLKCHNDILRGMEQENRQQEQKRRLLSAWDERLHHNPLVQRLICHLCRLEADPDNVAAAMRNLSLTGRESEEVLRALRFANDAFGLEALAQRLAAS